MRATIALCTIFHTSCYFAAITERQTPSTPDGIAVVPDLRFDPASPARSLTPTLTGDTTPGFNVDLFRNAGCEGVPIATTEVSDAGVFSFAVSVSDNTRTDFSVRIREAPELGCFATHYVHDGLPPAAAALSFTQLDVDRFTLLIEAEAGATWSLFEGSGCAGEPSEVFVATEDSSTRPVDAALGDVTISVSVTDAAGNTSCASATTPARGDVTLSLSNDPATGQLVASVAAVLPNGATVTAIDACLSPRSTGCDAFTANVATLDAVTTLPSDAALPGQRYFMRARVSGTHGLQAASPTQTVLLPSPTRGVARRVVVDDSTVCAIMANGTLQCWGRNIAGQVNPASTTPQPSARTMRLADGTPLMGVIDVAMSPNNICAVLADGRVLCWGNNGNQALGTGSTSPAASLVPVQANLGGAKARSIVSVNGAYCVVSDAQRAVCWGFNANGELGRGLAFTDGNGPPGEVLTLADDAVSIVPLDGVLELSGGQASCCARLVSGRVKCWGSPAGGALGNNNGDHDRLAVEVLRDATTPLTSVERVFGGSAHRCALRTDGTVLCWGRNEHSQQGSPATASIATATRPSDAGSVLDGATLELALGGDAVTDLSCALLLGGRVRCWGEDRAGQLGNPTAPDTTSVPIAVTVGTSGAELDGVVQISSGSDVSCALRANGEVWCWGQNTNLAVASSGTPLGAVLRSFPLQPEGTEPATPLVAPAVVQLTASHESTCARLSNGEVGCAGSNLIGELGDGSAGPSRGVFSRIAIDQAVRALWPARDGHCATLADGAVVCWGHNDVGQLGLPSTTPVIATPTTVPAWAGSLALAGGVGFRCGRFPQANELRCLGSNAFGQLGNGALGGASATLVNASAGAGPIGGVQRMSAGDAHLCIQRTDAAGASTVECVGRNDEQQLGRMAEGAATTLYAPLGLSGAMAVAAGGSFGCGVFASGLHCWGRSAENQTSIDGALPAATAPRLIDPAGLASSSPTAIASGARHTLALADGRVLSWGGNDVGQLGAGTASSTGSVAALRDVPSAIAIAAGRAHSCVVLADGRVRCAGSNAAGQLGTGDATDRAAFAEPLHLP